MSKAKDTLLGFVGLIGVAGVLVGGVKIAIAIADATGGPPPPPSCRDDWHLCTSAHQLIDHWRGAFWIRLACQDAGNDAAQYGKPKWNGLPFPWVSENGSLKHGIVTLLEPKAQFSNAFGAMVHVELKCSVALNPNATANNDENAGTVTSFGLDD